MIPATQEEIALIIKAIGHYTLCSNSRKREMQALLTKISYGYWDEDVPDENLPVRRIK